MTDNNSAWNPDEDYQYPLIMSGAGPFKYPDREDVDSVLPFVDLAVVGSITKLPRKGNTPLHEKARLEYFEDPAYTINVHGMPNEGMHAIGPPRSPKLIISLAEFSVDGFVEIYEHFAEWGAGTELNFGCPNTTEGIWCRKPESMDAVLSQITPRSGLTGVKLSPFLEEEYSLLQEGLAVIKQHSSKISYVVATNTLPGQTVTLSDGSSAVETVEMGTQGGLGGEAIKELALENATVCCQELGGDVGVLLCGGVSSGKDLIKGLDVGCVGVQVVSAFLQQGPRVFKKIREEYLRSLLA